MQRRVLGLTCCGLLLAACGDRSAVGAGQADPDRVLENGMSVRQVVEARALHMKDLGGSFKAVRDQSAQETPNLALIQMATQEVESASQDLPSWFPDGTGPDTGLKMRALAEVWTDDAGFAESASAFRTEAARLNELARAGDVAGVREQTRAVRKTCGGCHDAYRAPPDPSDKAPSDG
jgi:cytochrome c556